jgi:hypothetical protein
MRRDGPELISANRLLKAALHGIEKANHAKVDWRKTAYCASSSGQRTFWWFALPERSAQLARKTRILLARIAGDQENKPAWRSECDWDPTVSMRPRKTIALLGTVRLQSRTP